MAAASTSAIIAAATSGSKQRTGDSSTFGRSSGVGRWSVLARAAPIWMTWLMTCVPSSASSSLASVPAATRAAVSRALARSRTLRASSNPYFCIPTRSAWPGRGVCKGFSVTPGAGDISSCHFGHSVLWMTIETGEPSVSPWRMPPRISTSSRSKRIRGPRPKPSRRRASSSWSCSSVTERPAGSPSTTTVRAGPCDSPAVK